LKLAGIENAKGISYDPKFRDITIIIAGKFIKEIKINNTRPRNIK